MRAGNTLLLHPARFAPTFFLFKTICCSAPLYFPFIFHLISVLFLSLFALLLRKLDHEDVVLSNIVTPDPDPSYLSDVLSLHVLITPSSNGVTAVEAGSDCLIEDIVRNLNSQK